MNAREAGHVWILTLGVVFGLVSTSWAESDPDAGQTPTNPVPAEDSLRVPPSAPGPERTGGGASSPGIESLLQLPSGFVPSSERPAVAGASEAEWRRRFRKTRGELEEARNTLEATKRELDSVAGEGGGSQWNVAPAVGGASPQGNSPMSFKLRQELKRNRDSLEAAEKSLRQLRIEADLAGVPVAWREEASSGKPSPPTEFPTP